MIAEFVNNDGTYRRVWIRLTASERREYRSAMLSSWLMFWKSPVSLMSGNLEEIICGVRPERYVELKPW